MIFVKTFTQANFKQIWKFKNLPEEHVNCDTFGPWQRQFRQNIYFLCLNQYDFLTKAEKYLKLHSKFEILPKVDHSLHKHRL